MGFESSFVGACLVLGKGSMVELVWRLVPSVNLRKAVARTARMQLVLGVYGGIRHFLAMVWRIVCG